MKHHKLFKKHSDYESYKNSYDYITSNVSFCEDNCDVHFEKLRHNYANDYFTIEALEDGNVYFNYLPFATTEEQRYMEYSKDGGETWNRTPNVDGQEVIMTISMTIGEKALVRGSNDTLDVYNENEEMHFASHFHSDIEFNVYGNIMSLTHGDAFNGEMTMTEYMFNELFYDGWGDFNTGADSCYVVDASNLILPTTLADYCYNYMFYSCASLTTAPELPATALAASCYNSMFFGCTSLTTVPELPATTLTNYCYYNMFSGCTSLTTAPELPAMILADYCYNYMFSGCTSLTTAPELPATILTNYCYSGLFSGCTSLATAPELPATTLGDRCYNSMFSGCSSLTTAPELPATTLTNNCYGSMFGGCTSLTTAPLILPATTLANSCYRGMFGGCTSLTTAPLILPATTLTNYCYYNMFSGCTSLTTAPELPAMILANNCYSGMFQNCSGLNYIKAMFITTPGTTYTNNWVKGVSSTGTFVKKSTATWTTRGVNGIPTNWTVQTAST